MARPTKPKHGSGRALRFTRVKLQNWRNFREAEVTLGRRAFIVGPNASGKSNFLDALRFLRDIAKAEGGLASALAQPGRGGLKGVRCLFARKPSELVLDVDIGDDAEPDLWRYTLTLQRHAKARDVAATVESEVVYERGQVVAEQRRPATSTDWLLFSQTMLQQVQRNQDFRELVEFLASTRYLHVVPQVVRDARRGVLTGEDPFGGDLLRRMKETPKKLLTPRLNRIAAALKVAVPQFEGLTLRDDSEGRPHLYAAFRHWRANPTEQNEEVLSDGTLRLLGFLWSITERGGPLLLEEPELSLHDAVVAELPRMIERAQKLSGRQVIASTHSAVILGAPGIGPDEVHRVTVGENGSSIETAGRRPEIRAQLERGWTLAQAVLPLTQPEGPERLGALPLASD